MRPPLPPPPPGRMTLTQASCVAVGMRGLLVTGAPGAGKSLLCLRMIALGARLVADDGVILRRAGSRLIAVAPAAIAGRIEARGIGLVQMPRVRDIPLELHVDLDEPEPDRLPPPRFRSLLDVELRSLRGRGHPDLAATLTAALRPGARLLEIP
ncbi:HPr kinase/phosphorylase [Oceanicella sp. SM1341]|uniref:HPr kinase/phosphorylase n=1 Tax=Oceanicella sp. SM1341 TaxID=1548889 RepID=UPI001E6268A2|nr:HPr kinase/phosphatase C-terminal domain-containing protein [Oceanicella sp. SM1341]